MVQEAFARVYESLQPPASVRKIKEFEKATGLTIPDDWRESLRIHDGQIDDVGTGALGGLPLEPLDQVHSKLKFWRWLVQERQGKDPDERDTSYPLHAIKCLHQNWNWIPLDNWDGNCWGIDLDPGPCGVVGQIINFGRDDHAKYVLALSLAQFLEDMADEMEAGNLTVVRYAVDWYGQRVAKPDETKDITWICNFGPPASHRNKACAPSIANYYAHWSKAKLPDAFKKGKVALAP